MKNQHINLFTYPDMIVGNLSNIPNGYVKFLRNFFTSNFILVAQFSYFNNLIKCYSCFATISFVLSLFFGCSPTTVEIPAVSQALLAFAAGIVPVVILTINTQFGRWTTAKIRQEINKGMFPAFTNFNATTTVVFITFSF